MYFTRNDTAFNTLSEAEKQLLCILENTVTNVYKLFLQCIFCMKYITQTSSSKRRQPSKVLTYNNFKIFFFIEQFKLNNVKIYFKNISSCSRYIQVTESKKFHKCFSELRLIKKLNIQIRNSDKNSLFFESIRKTNMELA